METPKPEPISHTGNLLMNSSRLHSIEMLRGIYSEAREASAEDSISTLGVLEYLQNKAMDCLEAIHSTQRTWLIHRIDNMFSKLDTSALQPPLPANFGSAAYAYTYQELDKSGQDLLKKITSKVRMECANAISLTSEPDCTPDDRALIAKACGYLDQMRYLCDALRPNLKSYPKSR